jgi:archaellum component FlaC
VPEPKTLCNLLARMATLENELTKLDDRVAVLEDCTQNYQSRLEDLETWQDKVDDRLDEEL